MANITEALLIVYTGLLLVFMVGCFLFRKHKEHDYYVISFLGGLILLFGFTILSVLSQIFFYLILVYSILIPIIIINRYLKIKANKKKPLPFKTWLKRYGGGWSKGIFGSDIVDRKFEEYEEYKEQFNNKKEGK